MAQKLKKIFLLLSLLLSFSLPVFAVDYCQDANVIGAYYFNETSGSADDCSSNNRDLTNTGPTLNVTGVFGSGYSYDGTNDVSSSTNAGFDFTGGETANFTVIFHANIASSQADGGRVVHRGEAGVNGYQIVADTNGTIVAGGYNTNSWQVREEITYTADSYAHYAFVYTASGGSFTDVDIFLMGFHKQRLQMQRIGDGTQMGHGISEGVGMDFIPMQISTNRRYLMTSSQARR